MKPSITRVINILKKHRKEGKKFNYWDVNHCIGGHCKPYNTESTKNAQRSFMEVSGCDENIAHYVCIMSGNCTTYARAIRLLEILRKTGKVDENQTCIDRPSEVNNYANGIPLRDSSED